MPTAGLGLGGDKKKLPRGRDTRTPRNFCREESVGGNRRSTVRRRSSGCTAILTHPDDGHVVQRRGMRGHRGQDLLRPFGRFFNTGHGGVPQLVKESALERDLSGGDHSLAVDQELEASRLGTKLFTQVREWAVDKARRSY